MSREFIAANTELLRRTTLPASTFTMHWSCWFYLYDLTNSQTMMCLTGNDSTDEFRLEFRPTVGGENDVVHAAQLGGASQRSGAEATVIVNTWHHVQCRFNSSTTFPQVWLDGVLGADVGGGTANPTGLTYYAIGAIQRPTPIFYVDGLVAECAIWNSAVSTDQLLALSQGFSPLMVQPANLVSYHPMGGIQKNDADFDIVHGQSMTPVNTPTTGAHPPGIIYPQSVGGGGQVLAAAGGVAPTSVLYGSLVGSLGGPV